MAGEPTNTILKGLTYIWACTLIVTKGEVPLCFIFSYACSACFTTGQYEKHISVTTDNKDDFRSNVIVSRVEAITRYRELTPKKVMGHKVKFMIHLYVNCTYKKAHPGTKWHRIVKKSSP